ncbi:uracil-xanthine permease family protein [Ruminococcaceae bacterium OttesenSCG-928-N02]|nr:uracil-xanthine permease family protein [Ruminococcaceae bacterium OttesenSCG-928-N02]
MKNENTPIYDARALGWPKLLLLGLQHTFAMFGATVLVPIITGLNVSTALLTAGLGTLLFHFLTKGKVPAFLGSSFAFLSGFALVAPKLPDGSPNLEMLPYATGAVVVAGLVYVIFSLLISLFGVQRVMRLFPPVVTGPIIVSIGLILAPSAITNASTNWALAFVALASIVVCNIWGKGMVKIMPILIGIGVAYAVAAVTGNIDFTAINAAKVFAMAPITAPKFDITAIVTIVPIAIATMVEHIGDVAAISATCEKNFIEDPGLQRTILGDGLATMLAGFLGGPANTTYGENTGVLVLTQIFDPLVVRIAAVFAIALSFVPKFGAIINTIPTAIIGGVSFILYGMISAVGVRNIVENKVDFTQTRNLIIAAVILVSALGFNATGGITFAIAGVSITLSGLAVAAIAGIALNLILPGNDYNFYIAKEDGEPEQITEEA